MPTLEPPTQCPMPKCGEELKRHCPETNTTCYWQTCSRCRITLDPRNWRAIKSDGTRVNLPAREAGTG